MKIEEFTQKCRGIVLSDEFLQVVLDFPPSKRREAILTRVLQARG
jgi:hypothetical protein